MGYLERRSIMDSNFAGTSRYIRFSGETFQFDRATTSNGLASRSFIPSQGGGYDLTFTNGYSAFNFGFFGVYGSAGAGLFLSKYAPDKIVTDFTKDDQGKKIGLVESDAKGEVTYLGPTLQASALVGFNMLDPLRTRWAKAYFGAQVELEGRVGIAVENSIQNNETMEREVLLDVPLFRLGLGLFVPMELVEDQHHLILTGTNQFLRVSVNNIANYTSFTKPNFHLGLTYLFQLPDE